VPQTASSPRRRASTRRRPQARGVATRRRLLGAAERRFADAGYDATSMNEIADAAGVGVGTLYHHFSDKRALLLALIDDWGDRELARERAVDVVARYLGPDPRAAIEADLGRRAERLRREGGFQLLLMQLADRDYDVRARLDRILQVGRERLRDLVVLGQRRRVFRPGVDPLAAAFLVQNAIHMTASEVFVHQHRDVPPAVMLAELADMICRYLLEDSP
jgi:AcrR family transcriptional regulator